MARPQLRPLTVGEMLDAVFSIYRNRFKDLVLAVAVVGVPIGILSVIATWMNPGIPNAFGFVERTAFEQIVSFVGIVGSLLVFGVVSRIVAGEYLDETIGWRAGISKVLPRLLSLLGQGLLLILVFGVVLIGSGLIAAFISVFPGVLAWLGILVPIAFFVFAIVSVFPSIPIGVVEGLGPWSSIKRAQNLVVGRRWAILGVLTVLFVILLVSFAAFLAFFELVVVSDFRTQQLAIGLSTIVVQLFTEPLMAIGATVIYFDQRVRKEAFDLELLADQVGSSADSSDFGRDSGTEFGSPPPVSDSYPEPKSDDVWPPSGQ